MATPLKQILLNQLHSLKHTGFDTKLILQAKAHNFPASYLFAIASRETNCLNILGDYQSHEAHGVGIVQIDIQHAIAKQARDDGTWKTKPEPLIGFGAQILKTNIEKVKEAFPNFNDRQVFKIAASGYNCGVVRAINATKDGGDSDKPTTGHDYGRDVMTRMDIFEELLAEGH
jgi:hypothetical protein